MTRIEQRGGSTSPRAVLGLPKGTRTPKAGEAPPLAIAPFDAAKAKEHQAAWAKHLGVSVETTNSIGMKLMLIPPGEFDMGSSAEQVARLVEEAKAQNAPSGIIDQLRSEAPKHRVRITKPFWLSCHEVTRGQFRRFVDDRGYQTEAERDGKGGFGFVNGQWVQDPRFVWNAAPGFSQTDDHPVVTVSWSDAVAFCEWLSQKERVKCHLPTEAQWEYACRAGTTTSWHCGDNETTLTEYAWFKANSGGTTHPVGQLRPNAWGLCDMHGNVWEWCQDWYGEDASGSVTDPSGPPLGSRRVDRGGRWDSPAAACRSACRTKSSPGSRDGRLGFRLAAVQSPR
jgi:formylglycine-generating enzyme required for sulfatase activity